MSFNHLPKGRQQEIASKGGKRAHELGKAHQFTSEEARDAGRKGGLTLSEDREHMRAIGRKGGEKVAADREHMAEIGRKGGEATSKDREHMKRLGQRSADLRWGKEPEKETTSDAG